VAQHVSGSSYPPPAPSIIRDLHCTRSFWFYRWRVAVGALLVVVWQTTTNNAPKNLKKCIFLILVAYMYVSRGVILGVGNV
jgi:hypothetical protein